MEVITKEQIERKMKEIWIEYDGFRDIKFDIPRREVIDFIRYETLKELLED